MYHIASSFAIGTFPNIHAHFLVKLFRKLQFIALLDGIRRHFHKYVYCANGEAVEFKLAKLGNDAGVYGAFKLIVD